MNLDLADFQSIRNFCKLLKAKSDGVDILINNGGVMFPPLTRTIDGLELTFGVNYIGAFLLTNTLMPMLQNVKKSRIVNMSSIAQYRVKDIDWENIKHIVISHINEYYSEGNEFIIDDSINVSKSQNYGEIEKKIIHILETKIRPAVARDGGDIKFKEFKNGVVTVQLQGSCSGCPSSTMTLKQGVQNLLCHYIPDVKEVIAIQE